MSNAEPEEVTTERVEQPRALQTRDQGSPGLMPAAGPNALGLMSDAEFNTKLEAMVKGRERMQQIQRALMKEGVHYGKVPGREKDPDAKHGLLKPGAEVLRALHGLVPDFEHVVTYGDLTNQVAPAISIRTRCTMHRGTLDGPVVAVGYGAANSWETKYRYRQAARECPACGKTTIMRSKFEKDRGPLTGQRVWWCNTKANGCGEEFAPDDARITEQVVGRVTNEDALDLENTLTKMAEKRADNGATIRATSASDLFIDMEGMEGAEGSGAEDREGGASSTAAAPAKPKANGKLATEAQLTYMRNLAGRLGLRGDDQIKVYLVGRVGRAAEGWPQIEGGLAGKLITDLKAEVEKKPAPEATAKPAAAAPREPDKVRAAFLGRLLQLAQEIEKVCPGRTVMITTVAGLHILTDAHLVGAMGFHGDVSIDELAIEDIERLGKLMHGEIDARRTLPQGARS